MEQNQTHQTQGQPQTSASPAQIDSQKFNLLLDRLRGEQNLPAGAAAGLVAALIGAVVWAVVTYVTHYQIGWMAVGVGFLVGYAVRLAGKGIDKTFGIVGASLAFFGCALGNLLAICALVAKQENASLLTILANLDLVAAGQVLLETFQPMDLLFYGIAIYEGYKFSFRQITEQDLTTLKTS
ncbi:MAG: hypothetical protein ACRENG_19765 [bacterium]